jgi:hypothetical protein
VRADAIDDYINAEIARQHVPGLAFAVMKHGQLVRAQGHGFANSYCPETESTSLGSGVVVIVEHPTETLAPPHWR